MLRRLSRAMRVSRIRYMTRDDMSEMGVVEWLGCMVGSNTRLGAFSVREVSAHLAESSAMPALYCVHWSLHDGGYLLE